MGFGATGYAADVLEQCVRSDVNIVETVAHMMSAVHFFGDVDVICDIGGQDIKVLFMKNGDIANFRLSNSCSAGNGMLLQATAESFGVRRHRVRRRRLQGAELAPKFSYGCAVFLETDRVNFQKEGFSKEEMLAGLAQVLPKNVWQYVVQIPRMASLGTQVRPPGRHAVQPGRAQGAGRLHQGARAQRRGVRAPAHRRGRRDRRRDGDLPRGEAQGRSSTFIGLDQAIALEYTSKNDEETVCHFCENNCKRTFIDTTRPGRLDQPLHRRLLLREGHRRVRAGDARARRRAQEARARSSPTWSTTRPSAAFMHFYKPEPMPEDGSPIKRHRGEEGLLRPVAASRSRARSNALQKESAGSARRTVRIGMPRVLNMYSTAPFFRTYFEALGIPRNHVVFSDETTEEMWVEGGKYGSIDPCFPSKVAQAHIHNLLFKKHQPDGEEAAQVHLLPHPHARAQLRRRHDGQRQLPDRGRRARGHEGGLHQGGRLLRDARHRVPRSGAVVRRADVDGEAPVRHLRRASV